MVRPTSKTQLIEQTQNNYDRLQTQLQTLTPDEWTVAGVVGEWSVKDVLAHLMAWQTMVLTWYTAGKRGENPKTPSEKYTWREIPALNQDIYETYRDVPLETIKQDFEATHTQILSTISEMTNDELFTPKIYKWTKSTTLGSYMTSATSSHYDWAYKEIRKGLRKRKSD